MTKKKKRKQVKSITPRQLSKILHNEFEKERAERIKKQRQTYKVMNKLKKIISVPIIIGVAAAIIMWFFYGWDVLLRTLLSWTIGLTILATIITLLERLMHNNERNN
ncbi:hypothetical protein GF374_02515 [Candidatus Woesearchaeota archaeon]|nr:hypothetical protein [Candidatus Woesearchaeota archaeon]